MNDKRREGSTFNNIGEIYLIRGDYDSALEYLKQSLSICRDIRDRKAEGTTLNNIGEIFQDIGEYDKSLEYLKQSLTILREIGDREGEVRTLNNISGIYDSRGNYDKAMRYLERSLNICRDTGGVGLCTTLFNIGHIHMTKEEFPEAMSVWTKAYQIARQIDHAQVLTALNNLAKDLGSSGPDFWVMQDKIKHQEAEFMLSHQINTLGLMASGMAHEINQPLQIILGRAQNCISDIRRKTIGTEQIIEDLEHIANTVKRIDKIVNHLQVLSREHKPELKRIDISKAIENSLIMFKQQLKNRGIGVELDLKYDLPPIRADMVQLEQVFINLINNARDSFEEEKEHKKL